MTPTDLHPTSHGRDPALSDAYARLSGSLAPPTDLVGTLDTAITRRRRQRRAGVVAGGALALALVGGTLALTTGGTEPETAPDPAGQGGVNEVVVTRDDGARMGFGPVELSCEEAGRLGQRLTATSPLVTAPGDDDTLLEPLLDISVLVDDVELRRTYELPFEGSSTRKNVSSDEWTLQYFAAVPSSDPTRRANEITSAAPDSSGTIRFDAATCGAVPSLDVTIDAVLGSELEQPAYPIAGRLALP
ncbi:hypothetical protein I601_1579 [Nocardioides dokdonensis FR1436]|uniref:Uncharacterized protein n=1 Tax=Nocardioides dokdonensis FR1436 TaxID=1300347 RepID=A0A1A9GK23_9ACTN|nr:hypothetical protein [Nocardioides dokdonensis]ANH38012.1 hypothetical protein I601_1579 [Nocardioides dokdonensis FR1436]